MHVCVCVCVHFMYVRDHIMIIYSIMCMYVCTDVSEYVRVCACVCICVCLCVQVVLTLVCA